MGVPDAMPANRGLDESAHAVMQRVASVHGLRISETGESATPSGKLAVDQVLGVLAVLESQTANTELRGGQAGGFSSIYSPRNGEPLHTRVRCVARKRHPLSRDLASMFEKSANASSSTKDGVISVIGHTRFATSSVNSVPELHPHQWSPFKHDSVWQFSLKTQRFEKKEVLTGLHLTHNGDFDALHMYGETVTVNSVGLWLEKVLHVPNSLRGDSPKLAGCMEVFHCQGRWNRAARLAWVRTIMSSSASVCEGPLSRDAENLFPDEQLWTSWSRFLESIWVQHTNNVIKITMRTAGVGGSYEIDREAEKCMVRDMIKKLTFVDDDVVVGERGGIALRSLELLRRELRCQNWDSLTMSSFISFATRDFLRADLYSALTELLSRAEGSFGVQVHSPSEPGVVVIASKGQPMSIAFESAMPLILFGSEATALTVSVTQSGQWLRSRIDLDSQGEIMRLGKPREMLEGAFLGRGSYEDPGAGSSKPLQLISGIEVRSYSLVSSRESPSEGLLARAIPIVSVPVPTVIGVDLVAEDIKSIPNVVRVIDKAWSDASPTAMATDTTGGVNPKMSESQPRSGLDPSAESRTAKAFCAALLCSFSHRMTYGLSGVVDLIITGTEVSLWMGEQFAADLRMVFPLLNVKVVSANKLLGLGHLSPERTFFPGNGDSMALEHQIDRQYTACLLISQSGQTFPTLHAAFSLADFVDSDKLWLVTGTFNSKIENVIIGECFRKREKVYINDRVFNNYSGHRPAEPSSVAAVATWHTLSHLLLYIIETVKQFNAELASDHRVSARGPEDRYETFDGDESSQSPMVMLLSEGCIGDLRSLLLENTVKNLENITQESGETHTALVAQGRHWGAHIAEPWNILVFVGIYIILSVGLNLPIFGLLADLVVVIIRAAGGLEDQPTSFRLVFPMRYPSVVFSQPVAWTVVGAILQFADALWFVFLAKIFTWGDRWFRNRALSARMGKRSIVIVDQPVVHQMLENFVSKLYAQAYSFVTPEVQSACGQDEFVHIFTHRVVRGLLLAVGRPDGRLGCLSKSENAVLLATKQAAFIRNPAYAAFDGSAPEIMTVSHNPFVPPIPGVHLTIKSKRRKFLEEVLFEELHQEDRPFTAGILRSFALELMSRSADSNEAMCNAETEGSGGSTASIARFPTRQSQAAESLGGEVGGSEAWRPLGAHLIGTDVGSSLHGSSVHSVGNATSSLQRQGPSSGMLLLSSSTHGAMRSQGSATGLHGLSSSTHGAMRSQGSATGLHGLSSSMHGAMRSQGSATGLHGLSSSTHGVVRRPRSQSYDATLPAVVKPPQPPSALQLTVMPRPSVSAQRAPQWMESPEVETNDASRFYRESPEVSVESSAPVQEDEQLLNFFHNARETRKARKNMTADLQHSLSPKVAEASNDPHARLIFSLKTDNTTREIQDQEYIIQSFYEDRVAALERFVSFCVLFHAMAQHNSKPLLLPGWDISRSQSYLRVATTASPVSASEAGGGHKHSAAVHKMLRHVMLRLRRVQSKF